MTWFSASRQADQAEASVTEIWFQYNRAIAGDPVRPEGFCSRLVGAGWVTWFYAYKDVLPARLLFVYPRWEIAPTRLLHWAPVAALAAVFAVA